MFYEDIIFNDLFNKRMGKIHDLRKQIDLNNLTCKFKGGKNVPTSFIAFKGPLDLYKNIDNGDKSIEKSRKRSRKT